MNDMVRWGSEAYWFTLALLLFGRGMDLLSTWVATPNLVLEANPIAKKLGWKWGVLVNAGVCLVISLWPLPALVVVTTSLLVAARNFKSAWWMRSLGEARYQVWVAETLACGHLGVYAGCVIGETALVGLIGACVLFFGFEHDILFAIGTGIIAYALVVAFYTFLSLWRLRSVDRAAAA